MSRLFAAAAACAFICTISSGIAATLVQYGDKASFETEDEAIDSHMVETDFHGAEYYEKLKAGSALLQQSQGQGPNVQFSVPSAQDSPDMFRGDFGQDRGEQTPQHSTNERLVLQRPIVRQAQEGNLELIKERSYPSHLIDTASVRADPNLMKEQEGPLSTEHSHPIISKQEVFSLAERTETVAAESNSYQEAARKTSPYYTNETVPARAALVRHEDGVAHLTLQEPLEKSLQTMPRVDENHDIALQNRKTSSARNSEIEFAKESESYLNAARDLQRGNEATAPSPLNDEMIENRKNLTGQYSNTIPQQNVEMGELDGLNENPRVHAQLGLLSSDNQNESPGTEVNYPSSQSGNVENDGGTEETFSSKTDRQSEDLDNDVIPAPSPGYGQELAVHTDSANVNEFDEEIEKSSSVRTLPASVMGEAVKQSEPDATPDHAAGGMYDDEDGRSFASQTEAGETIRDATEIEKSFDSQTKALTEIEDSDKAIETSEANSDGESLNAEKILNDEEEDAMPPDEVEKKKKLTSNFNQLWQALSKDGKDTTVPELDEVTTSDSIHGPNTSIDFEEETDTEAYKISSKNPILPMLMLLFVLLLICMLCSKMPSYLYSTWIAFNSDMPFFKRWWKKGHYFVPTGDKSV